MASAYLKGLPSAGLLILRFAVGVCSCLQAYTLLNVPSSAQLLFTVTAALLALSGTLLLVGFLFRTAAALACGIHVLVVILSVRAESVWSTACDGEILSLATAAAFWCLGPGSLSLDARLFGLREIALSDDREPLM